MDGKTVVRGRGLAVGGRAPRPPPGNYLGGGFVQRRHAADGAVDPGRLGRAFLDCGRDHARAEGFGEDETVAGQRSGVADDAIGVDEAGDGVAELDFFVADAVAADHGAPGFEHLAEPAGQDLLENPEIALRRETQVGQSGNGAAAHGIDVAQGIGGGDLAEGEGIVDHGGEEIHGLHERLPRADLVDAGIVGVIEAHENIRIVLPRQLSENRVEHRGAELRGTASGFDGRGKADGGSGGHRVIVIDSDCLLSAEARGEGPPAPADPPELAARFGSIAPPGLGPCAPPGNLASSR